MADAPALCEHVVAAVRALYSHDPASQQEANSWLTAFVGSDEAWEVCLVLLMPGNPTEVQFYSANTILKKVREQWGGLSGPAKTHLVETLNERLQTMVTQSVPQLVTGRMSIVVSLSAVLSGEEAAMGLVQRALGMAAAGSHLDMAVELLKAVADEAEQLDRGKRQAVVPRLVSAAPEVLAMVEAVLAGRLDRSHAASSCRCLSAWLRLDVSGAGGKLLSLGDMYSQQRALLEGLLLALGDTRDEVLVEAASEVLIEVMSSSHAASDTDAERAATRTVMAALLRHGGGVAEADEVVAHALCAVASAVAERDIGAASGAAAEALPLSQLLLSCLGRSERRVVGAALDYFLMLNTVPLAERHTELRQPLFASMVSPLLRHATMPADLHDWNSYSGDDKDAFVSFRDEIIADALDTCYGLLRTQFLVAIANHMAAADTWQKAEVCLFAMRSVAVSLKARVLSERKADLVDRSMQAEKAETTSFLLSTFGRLTADPEGGAGGVWWSHVLVVEAVARAVGAYAAWFGACPDAPVTGALRLLLRALGIPQAGGHIKHSATALRNVCTRCSRTLLDRTALTGLMDATEGVVNSPASGSTLELEDRQAVVEGLARLVSLLPPADAAHAAMKLVTPLLNSARSLVGAEVDRSGAEAQAETLADELRLIASAVRFMEFAGDGLAGQPHPAVAIVEGVWPILTAVADGQRWSHNATAAAAVCDVFQRCMLALRETAGPLLEPMVGALVALLDAGPHAPAIATLGTCVEAFGSVPAAADLLSSGLSAVTERAMQRLQAMDAVGLAEHEEFVSATLQMADRYLVFAPGCLLRSSHLSSLLALTIRALAMTERDPVRAALNFAAHLSAPSQRHADSPDWHAAAAAINMYGESLVHGLAHAMAGSCPRHLLRVLSGCLFGLLTSPAYHGAVASVLPGVLMSADFPAVREGLLKEEDCKRFCSIALKHPPLPRQRFDALISDFAAICRSEGTSDALLAYEM